MFEPNEAYLTALIGIIVGVAVFVAADGLFRKEKIVSKTSDCQSHMPELFTASTLLDFRNEFSGTYSDATMINTFGAVGPMDAYLGWLVSTGRITINTET